MKQTGVAIVLTAALLASIACTATLYVLYRGAVNRNEALTAQLEALTREEKRTVVMQSINAQMEEIATQERRASDMQREEAIQQRKVAEIERQNALEQRREAEEQRQIALAAERKALEASDVARRERNAAYDQRMKAEYSKRVADTLSYIAMGRNLASQAVTQKTTGNEQLANLLAYASYVFTTRYGGDVYNPTIYQALSLTSESMRKWNVGKGAVIKMWPLQPDGNFVSVTTYGEILKHETTANGNLHTTVIMQNSMYDFRDLILDSHGTLYALSRTGHLVYGSLDNLKTTVVESAVRPFRLFSHKDGQLLVVAEKSVHLLSTETMAEQRRLALSFTTTVAGEDDVQLLVFDGKGNAYTVDNDAKTVKAKPLPFKPQPVMSYAYDIINGYEAYGTVEGNIFIADTNGGANRLVGHGSRVSKVRFNAGRLYSSSYDGTMRFWPLMQQKIVPITVIDSRQWIISFTFDDTMDYVWTGDKNGNLMQTLVNAHLMAEKVHGKLKREFTQEEWDYYIGRNVAYEKLKP